MKPQYKIKVAEPESQKTVMIETVDGQHWKIGPLLQHTNLLQLTMQDYKASFEHQAWITGFGGRCIILGFAAAEIPVKSGQWLLSSVSPYGLTEADLRDLVESEFKETVKIAAGVLSSQLSIITSFCWILSGNRVSKAVGVQEFQSAIWWH